MKRKLAFKNIAGIGGIFILLLLYLMIFEYRATEISEQDCKVKEGIVISVKEDGVKDAVFILTGTDTTYYINRALENRFSLAGLQNKTVGKKVKIYFSDHYSILRVGVPCWHLTKLEVEKEIVYTEH